MPIREGKVIVILLAMLFSLVAYAGAYEDGASAYEQKNYSAAMAKFKLAAARNHGGAQHHLGLMYGNGEGVVQDYAEAIKWFKLAATQGDARAQYNLGFMYGKGEGVVRDYVESVKWYRLAAAQGVANAQ